MTVATKLLELRRADNNALLRVSASATDNKEFVYHADVGGMPIKVQIIGDGDECLLAIVLVLGLAQLACGCPGANGEPVPGEGRASSTADAGDPGDPSSVFVQCAGRSLEDCERDSTCYVLHARRIEEEHSCIEQAPSPLVCYPTDTVAGTAQGCGIDPDGAMWLLAANYELPSGWTFLSSAECASFSTCD